MSMPESKSLQATEDASSAVAKAPRITKKFIEDNIVEALYCTGDQIADQIHIVSSSKPFAHLTLCMMLFTNGFIAVGKSAPLSPENFNAELGRQLAYEDAFRQAWPLYAFAALEDTLLYGEETFNPHNDGEPPSTNSAAPTAE